MNSAVETPVANATRIAAGEHPALPLQLKLSAGHRIELGENAQATVIVEFGDTVSPLTLDIHLARNARLRLYRIGLDTIDSDFLGRITAIVERDASLSAVTIDHGCGRRRQDFTVRLVGSGAEAELSGLYMPGAGALIDNETSIVHEATHGRSRETYRGIIGERGRAIFNGRVEVRPGAQKTDSEQQVANLLLSPRAQVNAKPELEIYADDVKCAHGATVGQLDEKALDYLRLRGIDEASARALMLRAFAMNILDRIDIPALRSRVENALGFAQDDALEALAAADGDEL